MMQERMLNFYKENAPAKEKEVSFEAFWKKPIRTKNIILHKSTAMNYGKEFKNTIQKHGINAMYYTKSGSMTYIMRTPIKRSSNGRIFD